MDLLKFQQNLLSIDVWELLKPIIEKHFEEIEQYNREQLSRGEMADGSAMRDYAEESYADFKSKYIPTYDIYPTTDLRYEGDFYRAIKASFDLYGISVESLDEKAAHLEKKYGSTIYGLTDESLKKLTDILAVELVIELKKAMLKE